MAGYYFLTGTGTALWGATLPATDARLDLGSGRLGTVLLVLGLGAAVAMPGAGWLADRWDRQRLLRLAALGSAVALAGPALAGSFGWLVAAAAVLGLAMGALNVALTLQVVHIERRFAVGVMSTMHGMWTLGAVLGGLVTTFALRAGADVRLFLGVAGIVLAVVFLVPGKLLGRFDTVAATETGPSGSGGPGFGLLLALGVIGAAAFLTEGAATDWAGIHVRRVLGAEPATASLVYTIFFAAMTVMRFAGDGLRGRLGPALTLRLACLTASAGYGLVLLAPATGSVRVATAAAGWVFAGAGMALVWPVVSSAMGAGAFSGRRLSTVTTISYTGGLIGPAVMGFIASASSLPTALTIPFVLAVAVAVIAPAVVTATIRGRRVDSGVSRSTYEQTA
ncbi:major facilitator superfamily MFS_1 [Stackebrandtia nassauensis DSM 44728]|uniref:Major facilitator superfamily MFS_1 n=2 Tax=Stackebrandtia TaxID=283810 RepID=D3Q029_STANL|nr:major facilitator superfamily MFS_1 [Stackebrandtia nassauensis DSM 44728]